MDLARIFGNWRTTSAAAVIIAVSGFDTFVFDLPQWNLGFSESIPIAFGLLVAKDAITGSKPGESS